jgi:hypothetical protein
MVHAFLKWMSVVSAVVQEFRKGPAIVKATCQPVDMIVTEIAFLVNPRMAVAVVMDRIRDTL